MIGSDGVQFGQDRHREPDRTGRILGLSRSGFHEVAYVEWGPVDAEHVVICVHGLTRQGRDFDYLASELASQGRRVDLPRPGRQREERMAAGSGRLHRPAILRRHERPHRPHGGAKRRLGRHIARRPDRHCAGGPSRTARSGASSSTTSARSCRPTPFSALAGTWPTCRRRSPRFDEAERYLREVLAPFGNVTDEHWRHLTTHSVREDPEQGRYLTLCDPAILQALKAPSNPGAHLWAYWDAIDHPILVVRGRDSDFLPSYLSKEMARRNPHAIVHDVPGCGHAPTLMPRDQVEAVAAFLTSGQETPASDPTRKS